MGDNVPNSRRKRVENSSCECCHRRKVRCDVNTDGPPCTNCRLDGRQCVLRVPLKRGRKSKLHRKEALSTSLLETSERPPEYHSSAQNQDNTVDGNAAAASSTHEIPSLPEIPECYSGNAEPAQVYVPFYYYNYLEIPDMQLLSPDDIHTLERQKCFQVPSGAVLDEFVRQFFLYVHPCLPMLNEGGFWSMYSKRPHAGPEPLSCSLVLFQAMLFASSRFVPSSVIKACGFDNPKHARSELRLRTELLMEYGLENNSIALAQACLLLSLQSTMMNQKLNSVWLSKAIAHSEAAKANYYYREKDSRHQLCLKRLWWSCILRDRMIALGVRRMIQIGAEKFDFDQAGLEAEDFAEECHESDVYDFASKKSLSKIVVAQCELAVSMTPMMITAYFDETPSQIGGPSVSVLIHSMTAVEKASTELSVWARRFRTALVRLADDEQDGHDANPSITLFAHMTLIHYYSAQIALCNHQVSTLQEYQSHLDDYGLRIARLSSELQACIAKVTEMIKTLSDKGLVHHLPISAPPCAALPFTLEIVNLRLSPSAEKQAHQQQLDYYNRIMALFEAQHEYTECVTTAVDTVLHVAEPEINSLAISRHPSQALTRSSGWSDIFTENPLFYIRLSLSLDAALSRGKAPLFTDLPVWAMGSSMNFHLPSIPTHLDFISPWLQQGEAYDPDVLRFIEVNEDDEAANADAWLDDDITNYGLTIPQ